MIFDFFLVLTNVSRLFVVNQSIDNKLDDKKISVCIIEQIHVYIQLDFYFYVEEFDHILMAHGDCKKCLNLNQVTQSII